MSAEREELRRLVEELPDEQVGAALAQLALVRLRAGGNERGGARQWPPGYFDLGKAERTDTAARVEEILAEGFGRSA